MATDQGGKRGPQSSRGGNNGSNRNDRSRQQHDDQDGYANANQPSQRQDIYPASNNTTAPAVPNFGFGFNMANFNPGFLAGSGGHS